MARESSDADLTSKAAMVDAVRRAARRFVDLVRSSPSPDVEVPATPPWTVTDVTGHLAMEPSRYRELARGSGHAVASPRDLPAFNAEQVRSLPTRDIQALSGKLLDDVDNLLATVEGFGSEQPLMPFDGGSRLPLDRALGSLLAEYLVHGWDVARALRSPWRIDAADVVRAMEALDHIAPHWLSPEARGQTASYALRLRGHATHHYVFRDGRLEVNRRTPVRSTCISAPGPRPSCSSTTGAWVNGGLRSSAG